LSTSQNTTPISAPEFQLRLPDDPAALVEYEKRIKTALQLFAPPELISVSEWAHRNRIMEKGTTSRPGRFRPEKFQIEMMDVILDPHVHEVVVKKSTQVGYSDAVLNNIVGYYIDVDPRPIMLVQPTIDDAKKYGKLRIAPMIESTPTLRSKIRDKVSRRSVNTLALKEFSGGFLKLTGANAGSGLRSDPVPIVLFDEVDGYPLDVEGEGDPIEIGTRRTDAFSDYKIVKGSTPAKPKGFSTIEKAFDRSDQRLFHVPCPFCGFMQPLLWRDPTTKDYRLTYAVNDEGEVIRESVGYLCANCKKKIPEYMKQGMSDAGAWVPTFPGRSVVGFYINALYSPWRENWHQLAQEFYEANAERNPEKLKAFVNLRLGETWEEQGDSLESHQLKSRVEAYAGDVPNGIGLLTASVDVQGDRLECVVKGWGDREESWLIAYQQFFGDPGAADVWDEVDEFLLTEFQHQSGKTVGIFATMIDSGGHHSDSVYRFVKARQSRRVFALKGSSEAGKEILGKFSVNNAYRVKLFTIGTDTAKDRIFSRMKLPAPGPGYMHLPNWIEDEYLAQLTAEKRIRKVQKGTGKITRTYVKTRARNEALDLEVYALAALYTAGQWRLRKLGELAEELAAPPEKPKPQDPGGDQGPQSPPKWGSGIGGGWVQRW
jgi:phage terminase large subunit GpA-like protein